MKCFPFMLASLITAAALASGCGNTSKPTSVTSTTLDSTAPQAPTGLAVVQDPFTGLDMLQWSPNTEPDLAKYQVYMYAPSPDRENAYVPAADITGSNRMRLPVLENNTTLYYRVRAVDTAGNRSAASPVIGAARYATAPPVDPPADDPPPILRH